MDNDPESTTTRRSSKSSKQKEGGSDIARREDREAKRKARSSGTAAPRPVPGAHASNGEHKSRTKSGKRSSDDSKSRSRSRKSDEKSDYRSSSRSSSASTTVPGAQAELSSPRTSRSKRDEKGKERRGTRATKPGVTPSTSSRERSKTKSSRSSNRARNAEAPVNEEGETVIASVIVEEQKEDEDTKKEREEARIREMVAAETKSVRQRMEAEHQRVQRKEEEMERREAERQEKEREEKKKKKRKRNIIMCAVLVLVIGGGVAAFFALQGSTSSSDTTVTQTTEKEEDASFGPSADPSPSPTFGPSSSPTNVPLKYEQPSLEECERIASGLPIDGEDKMTDRSFAVAMEVDLLDGNDIDPLVAELATKIEKLLVPDLIGCPRGLFDKRRLGLHGGQNNAGMSNVSDHPRQLQNMNIRYAIYKAIVSVTVTDDACEKSSSPNCSVVAANLDLKVRGDENIGLLAEVILDVFPNGNDIRPDLELIAPFNTIVIGIMRSLDPTLAPTIAPTGTASENPSGVPSTSPSTGPAPTSGPDIATSAPVTAPSDTAPVLAPTRAPSKAPSKAPTPPPTLAPTPTPPPTFAPQPGLTPQPTPPPTLRPTIAPSEFPSRNPSSKPSLAPSSTPSTNPSVALSSIPTIQASDVPSPAPTSSPTNSPTSVPTFNPTSTTATTPPPVSPGTSRLGFVPLLRQGMPMDQSSTLGNQPATNAVDGNYGTHTQTNYAEYTPFGSGTWWRIKLPEYYGTLGTVNKVTVWNRADCCQDRLEGAVVLLFGEGTGNIIATSAPLTSALVQTVDFGEVTGVQVVQVQQNSKNEYMNIAQVEAWGSIPNDTNNLCYTGLIKQGMYADQSSYWSTGRLPTHGIDGSYEDDSLAHTNSGVGEWWRVNLQSYYGQLVTVNKVTVWNRANSCCQERLEGAVVKLWGAGDGNLIATSVPLTSGLVQTVDFGEVTGVQWVSVQQDTQDTVLHFAEIEAWGKIP